MLVEGLGVGKETSIEEYIIAPANELIDDQETTTNDGQVRFFGPEEGLSWIARPVTRNSTLGFASRQGSVVNQSVPLMDPLVNLFGSVHDKLPNTDSKGSMLFPHFGSMFSVSGYQAKNEEWDEESLGREGEDYTSDVAGNDSDDNLHSPLISRQTTSLEKDMVQPVSHGTILSILNGSPGEGNTGGPPSSVGIGGGWQLAWKWTEREGQDGMREGGFKRIYLHQDGIPGSRRGSVVSLPGGDVPVESEFIQAAALVSQPALYSKELMGQHPVGPAMVHPSEALSSGPSWRDLFEPGVKHALFVGVGIQILQQVTIISVGNFLLLHILLNLILALLFFQLAFLCCRTRIIERH